MSAPSYICDYPDSESMTRCAAAHPGLQHAGSWDEVEAEIIEQGYCFDNSGDRVTLVSDEFYEDGETWRWLTYVKPDEDVNNMALNHRYRVYDRHSEYCLIPDDQVFQPVTEDELTETIRSITGGTNA